MRLVLDTNEFISAVGLVRNPSAELLLEKLLISIPKNTTHIPRIIINEIRRNLPSNVFGELIRMIHDKITIDENVLIPFELGLKYESIGLKPGDAMIASYCEWIQADILVSENRHFLSQASNLPFRVLTAEKALKLLH